VAGEAYRIEVTEDLGRTFDLWQDLPARSEDGPASVRLDVGPEPRFFRVRSR
jgi:hypothetical protein